MTTRAKKEYIKNKLDVITVTDKNNKTTSLLKLSQSIKATRIYRLRQLHDKIKNANHPFSQIKLSQRLGFFPIPCDDSLKKINIIYEAFMHIFTYHNELEYIDMRACNFTDDQLLTLFRLIKPEKLTYLDVSYMKITHNLAVVISSIIEHTQNMIEFKFNDVVCSPEDYYLLLDSIKHVHGLDRFAYDAKCINIKECDPGMICKIINASPNIKKLEIRMDTSRGMVFTPNKKAMEFCRQIITDNKNIKSVNIMKSISRDRYDVVSYNLHQYMHDEICLILVLLRNNRSIEHFDLEFGVAHMYNYYGGSNDMEINARELYQHNGIIKLVNFPYVHRGSNTMFNLYDTPTYNYQHVYRNGNDRNRANNEKRNTDLMLLMYKNIKHFRPQWLDNEETAARKRAKRAEYNKRKKQEHKAKLARIQ